MKKIPQKDIRNIADRIYAGKLDGLAEEIARVAPLVDGEDLVARARKAQSASEADKLAGQWIAFAHTYPLLWFGRTLRNGLGILLVVVGCAALIWALVS